MLRSVAVLPSSLAAADPSLSWPINVGVTDQGIRGRRVIYHAYNALVTEDEIGHGRWRGVLPLDKNAILVGAVYLDIFPFNQLFLGSTLD